MTYKSLEIRPVIETRDNTESFDNARAYLEALRNAGASGHSFKVFHSIYAIDGEGQSQALGDFDSENAARHACIGLGLPWSLMGRNIAATRLTNDEAETALCVWEAMLEAHGNSDAKWVKALDSVWDDLGTAGMRDLALTLAPTINDLWGTPEHALETWGDARPFDWEFVPFALSFYDWEARGWPFNTLERMLEEWHKPNDMLAPKPRYSIKGAFGVHVIFDNMAGHSLAGEYKSEDDARAMIDLLTRD